ncbi:MAG TPA: hypothetical protein VN368_01565 [Candidatus Methylomirabilis sp.]|nr:hypothetical protein [Candidatus Methylomirabilis sp.]
MFEKLKNRCGWFESPDSTGKAPKHVEVATRNQYKQHKPMTVCFEEPKKKKEEGKEELTDEIIEDVNDRPSQNDIDKDNAKTDKKVGSKEDAEDDEDDE